MDNRRLFLFTALVFVAFLIYQAWMRDYGPKPAVPPLQTSATSTAPAPGGSAVPAASNVGTAPIPASASAILPPKGRRIHVRTDVLDVVINTIGGDIRQAELLKYPIELKTPTALVKVLNTDNATLLIAQSGLQTLSGPDAPGYQTLYTASRTRYSLAPGEKTLAVSLTWKGPRGLEVEKTYTFTRGSYQVDMHYRVQNRAGEPWKGAEYVQFENHYVPESHSLFSAHRYDYQRVAVHGVGGYRQYEFGDLAETPVNMTTPGGWTAVVDHYFLAAVIPEDRQQARNAAENRYYSKSLGDSRFLAGTITSVKTVMPSTTGVFADTFYIGPKLQTRLAHVAPGLELTVDYGKLTIISEPIFKLLNFIHRFIGNWGWSILILTLLFKLAFFPLNQISGRSMAKMRRVQPRIKALQERYKDDKQHLSQAMMELYKKEKINPMSGCLPMIVQMPIFFALYYVLVYSVELRQSPWIGWIHDLSAPDPYYILPVAYAIVMFIQLQVNPQPTTDKIQRRVMMVMPLALGVLYAFLPSGLALYYVANSIISIGQQWHINRIIQRENRKLAVKSG